MTDHHAPWTARRATPEGADLERLRGIRLRALEDAPDEFESTLDGARAWSEESWRRWASRGIPYLLERAGSPVGIAFAVPHESLDRAVFLESVWLEPDQRGQGAADVLVGAVLDGAAAGGATEAWLHVHDANDRARGFYTRLGFSPSGVMVVRDRDGAREIEMRRALDRR